MDFLDGGDGTDTHEFSVTILNCEARATGRD